MINVENLDLDSTFGSLLDRFKEEPLHEDLIPHVRDTGMLGPMVHHPMLVHTLPFGIEKAAHVNALYLQIKTSIDEAIAAKKFHSAVFAHARPYRFDALVKMAREHGLQEHPKKYWELVGQVWTDSENIWESLEDWIDMWSEDFGNSHDTMTKAEKDHLSKLPNTITIWRGGGPDGLSWTTSEKVGRWFSQRFPHRGKPKLWKSSIEKANVKAFFLKRNEEEIVALPQYLGKIVSVK